MKAMTFTKTAGWGEELTIVIEINENGSAWVSDSRDPEDEPARWILDPGDYAARLRNSGWVQS